MATYCWWAANSCAICSSSLATNASAGIAPACPDARLGSPNMGRRGGEGAQTEAALLQGPPALQALPGRPQAPRGAGARGQGRRALRRRRRGEEEAAQGRSPLRSPACCPARPAVVMFRANASGVAPARDRSSLRGSASLIEGEGPCYDVSGLLVRVRG